MQEEKSFLTKHYPVYILVILGILIIASSSLLLAFVFNLLDNPFAKKEYSSGNMTQASPSPSQAVAVQTGEVPQTAKDTVKIQVLNGSGVRGLAAKIKEQLLGLGYKNIETGNSEGENQEETTIEVAVEISKDITDQITKALEKSFTKVSQTKLEKASNYQVIITTGKTK